MRAAVFHKFGEPSEVLTCEDVSPPELQSGHVRVRMIGVPVNPSDLMTVRGGYGIEPELPATPGYEGVGIVEDGSGVLGKLLKGRRIAVLNKQGGNWAEQVVIPARQAVPLSSSIPWEQAAMFFVNPTTAYVMTQEVLAVPKGEWLLQTAAGSALGQMVIRLGEHLGFRTLCVVRREEQAEQLRNAGANECVVFDGADHEPDQLRDAVAKITDGQGVKYAIDPVGGTTATAVVRCLGVGGRLLCFGTLSGEDAVFSPRHLIGTETRIEGFWLARWMDAQGLLGRINTVRKVAKLISNGVLTSEVGHVFPLEDVAEAVRVSEERGRGGKVLIKISEL
ncbi:zinc-dependent alcohol dehydrogenase family protein [Thalassoroseus pseudoceratinae]|uniref:zinc-dependent alcohol dehydrogenase family protein n=1 Tax=Thalassoroseus pseudoceratinae TaxID=2713176 RepID=UPI00141FA67F|nr:zinc-dependent alcohol dehydrogenase family protein [Thalassoroseus pseudoceratinae]